MTRCYYCGNLYKYMVYNQSRDFYLLACKKHEKLLSQNIEDLAKLPRDEEGNTVGQVLTGRDRNGRPRPYHYNDRYNNDFKLFKGLVTIAGIGVLIVVVMELLK